MDPSDLSPKLVRSFLTVLRMQSHTKAAQALNLTQPAVTKHINRLEDYFGFKLLEKSRGVVLPTPEAQMLLPDLERLEKSVENICGKARGVITGGQQLLQIAATSSMISNFLIPAVQTIGDENEDVYPVFREVDDHRVYDMVRDGSVDVALTSMTGNDGELSCQFLFQDRPCLVCPSDHTLAKRETVRIEEILTFSLIRPPVNTSSNQIHGIFAGKLGAEFNYVAEASRLMTMEIMVRAGLGLLILPALSARLISHSGLTFLPIDSDEGWRECQVIHQRFNQKADLIKRLVGNVRHLAYELEDQIPDLVVCRPRYKS